MDARLLLRRGARAGLFPALVLFTFSGCTPLTVKPGRFAELPADHTEAFVSFPKGDWSESVLMVRKTAPKQVRVGQDFEYTIEIYNPTDHVILKNLVVKDYIDPSLELTSATPEWESLEHWDEVFGLLPEDQDDLDEVPVPRPRMEMQQRGQEQQPRQRRSRAREAPEVRWLIEELYPEKMVTIRVQARPRNEGAIINCVTADYEMAACVESQVVAPELRLSAQLERDFVICATDQADLSFVVSNTGTGEVKNVVVETRLPQGLSIDGGQSYRADVGDLKSGERKEVATQVRVREPGRYIIRSRAISADQVSTEVVDTRLIARQGALDLRTAGPRVEYVGLPVEYEIQVLNVGNAPVREVQVQSLIPTGTEFIDATDGGQPQEGYVRWRFDSLDAGDARTVYVRYRGTDEAGTVRNVVTARGVCTGDISSTVRTDLEGVPAMVVEVVDTQDPNRVGEIETYRITVHNQGSAAETNVIVRGELEEEMEFVAARGPTQTGAKPGARAFTFAPVPSLAPDQTVTWEVDTRCLAAGDIRFYVEVDSDQHGRPVRETEATVVVE